MKIKAAINWLRGKRSFIVRPGLGYPVTPLAPIPPFYRRVFQIFGMWL